MTMLSPSPKGSDISNQGYARQGRRSSRAPAISIRSPDAEHVELESEYVGSIGSEPSTPDSTNFHKSLEIDMKALIGDAVGNMSISPSSRDVVLAARRGLYIIDLESPLKIPRFLPQGGTWDVADVQWNPHPHRAEYVVSTSSEKLLIWNLGMGGKTSIEHVLLAHYRAITDINWHTTEPDTVVSTGIDSWIWAWDLRTPRKPIFGLSAFNEGGTQVKCNRSDPNILASSHSNQVLVWDRRNGALPISRVNAHSAKIYGIDWSHTNPSEIVTCSLDRTIKVWDTKDSLGVDSNEVNPSLTMHTSYPVWRARNLPFGRGILSLPQRGETALEMYSLDGDGLLVDTFEGHTDVVKEFVWRKNLDEFQLITWSKDGTLRFWPVDSDTKKKVGHSARGRSKARPSLESTHNISFRKPPQNQDYKPIFQAPIGSRGIFAEVRAQTPARTQNAVVPYPPTMQGGSFPDLTSSLATAVPVHVGDTPITRGGTMSRGNTSGKSYVKKMDPLIWLNSVKVDGSRARSSSGPESAEVSRVRDDEEVFVGRKRRSESREERRETEDGSGGQSLHQEITSVVTKLQNQHSAKINIEKAELSKKRSCTFGLHGPWGETSSVFMRVTFVFPKDYPHREYPDGIPSVDLERNPLISQKDRFFVLRKLRAIRERRRPCLEACLRFLLFAEEGDKAGNNLELADSSSEEEDGEESKAKEITVSLLRNTKNLAEPRTSQGTFGPNGELVCFFQAAPRFVRHVHPSDTTVNTGEKESPDQDAHDSQGSTEKETFKPPALLSDALRLLHASALDRPMKSFEDRQAAAGGDRFFRFTTNFLTLTNTNQRHSAERLGSSSPSQTRSQSQQDTQAREYSYVASRRSTVFMVSTLGTSGGDKIAGEGYIFQGSTIAALCDRNAAVARSIHRYDHERVFRTLGALFLNIESEDNTAKKPLSTNMLLKRATDNILNHYRVQRDIQMLAMVSVIILQAFGYLDEIPTATSSHTDFSQTLTLNSVTATPGRVGNDYFSLTRRTRRASTATGRPSPNSPHWPPRMSPSPGATASAGSSGSSRGSWGSIFNPGTVRQFVAGMGETLKDGLATPMEEESGMQGPIAVPTGNNFGTEAMSRARRTLGSSISRSWNEKTSIPAPLLGPAGSGTLARRRNVAASSIIRPEQKSLNRKKVVFFTGPENPESIVSPRPAEIDLLIQPILVYADMLFRWELNQKRLELLKVVRRQDRDPAEFKQHEIGLVLTCVRCSVPINNKHTVCVSCSHAVQKPSCTVCRLPVKGKRYVAPKPSLHMLTRLLGLSHSCMQCLHISHMSCWRRLNATICPSGCGCFCSGLDEAFMEAEYDLASPTIMR